MSGYFSNEECSRYSRHLIMPEVGLAGQRKLKQASVLCIGVGGLGSPLAIYLAAAGVGRIGLVDFDTVDYSNLHRQILHYTQDVGRPKLDSAAEKLSAINPEVEVIKHGDPFSSANAMQICQDYDVIVDGTDNFPTRYLTNDVCVLLGKPNVYASIYQFEGQASVFNAKEGPCYRCLYPEPPPPGMVPSCADGGVLGVLPGIMGTIQATEVIKIIIGKGKTLIGRLLLFDALNMRFTEMRLEKDPGCPICGENPTIHELCDYEGFCGVSVGSQNVPLHGIGDEWEISPRELYARIVANDRLPYIIDVREPHEWEIGHLPYAHLIPERELLKKIPELSSSDTIILYCRTGVRSARALRLFREAGYSKVKHLVGGINGWANEVDPTIPKY